MRVLQKERGKNGIIKNENSKTSSKPPSEQPTEL